MSKIDWDKFDEICLDPEFTVFHACKEFNVDLNELLIIFKEEKNDTFASYIQDARVKSPRTYTKKLEIDWEYVKKRFIEGCSVTAVSKELGFSSSDPVTKRCKGQFGVTLKEFRESCYQKGNNLLHRTQFAKALKGDNTMLTWLGKNRLQQADKLEMKDQKAEKLDLFLNVVKELDPESFEKHTKIKNEL